jgi:AcrR family transcriptional regulator
MTPDRAGAGPDERIEAILVRAVQLLASTAAESGNAARPSGERLSQVIDAQRAPPHDGSSAPLAAPVPDAIPMTGEEDPLVEVDDPDFAAVVAEYMRSEHRAETAEDESPRVRLARALSAFADDSADRAALLKAIEGPFERYAAALAADPGPCLDPSDAALIECLIAIVERS